MHCGAVLCARGMGQRRVRSFALERPLIGRGLRPAALTDLRRGRHFGRREAGGGLLAFDRELRRSLLRTPTPTGLVGGLTSKVGRWSFGKRRRALTVADQPATEESTDAMCAHWCLSFLGPVSEWGRVLLSFSNQPRCTFSLFSFAFNKHSNQTVKQPNPFHPRQSINTCTAPHAAHTLHTPPTPSPPRAPLPP